MTAPGFVVAGPVGYLGRGTGSCVDTHDCPLDEAHIYFTEAAAVSAQRMAMAAGGVGLTVHEVDLRWWLEAKQAAS
jgi:hypothetical protein